VASKNSEKLSGRQLLNKATGQHWRIHTVSLKTER